VSPREAANTGLPNGQLSAAESSAGPPAHWLELVRQRAPQLLQQLEQRRGLGPTSPTGRQTGTVLSEEYQSNLDLSATSEWRKEIASAEPPEAWKRPEHRADSLLPAPSDDEPENAVQRPAIQPSPSPARPGSRGSGSTDRSAAGLRCSENTVNLPPTAERSPRNGQTLRRMADRLPLGNAKRGGKASSASTRAAKADTEHRQNRDVSDSRVPASWIKSVRRHVPRFVLGVGLRKRATAKQTDRKAMEAGALEVNLPKANAPSTPLSISTTEGRATHEDLLGSGHDTAADEQLPLETKQSVPRDTERQQPASAPGIVAQRPTPNGCAHKLPMTEAPTKRDDYPDTATTSMRESRTTSSRTISQRPLSATRAPRTRYGGAVQPLDANAVTLSPKEPGPRTLLYPKNRFRRQGTGPLPRPTKAPEAASAANYGRKRQEPWPLVEDSEEVSRTPGGGFFLQQVARSVRRKQPSRGDMMSAADQPVAPEKPASQLPWPPSFVTQYTADLDQSSPNSEPVAGRAQAALFPDSRAPTGLANHPASNRPGAKSVGREKREGTGPRETTVNERIAVTASGERREPAKSKLPPPSWPGLEARSGSSAEEEHVFSRWPALPPDPTPVESVRRWQTEVPGERAQARRRRLDMEQRGIPWSM
jgi:hypothetical protein